MRLLAHTFTFADSSLQKMSDNRTFHWQLICQLSIQLKPVKYIFVTSVKPGHLRRGLLRVELKLAR